MSTTSKTKTGTTWLVTGGAGFIGSNFVGMLAAEMSEGDRLVIVDALTYAGNVATIADVLRLPSVEFHKADIADEEAMGSIFAQCDPDIVVNFAAESHVDRSIASSKPFITTNIVGTQTLLEAARRQWTLPGGGFREGCRFVQISTDEVYGSLSKDFDVPRPLELGEQLLALLADRKAPVTYGREAFTETTPLAPRSPYSASKAAADMLALAWHETYGLPVNVTRCSNNYGPAQFPEKLIPLVINNMLEGREIPVYGRGLNVRDWLYVDDHCRAVKLVALNGKPGRVYNIGGLNEVTNIDIVETVGRAIDAAGPRIRYVSDRPGHDMRYAINPSRIVEELGWLPATPFDKGIARTVDWYQTHRDWLNDVVSGDYRKYYETHYSNR